MLQNVAKARITAFRYGIQVTPWLAYFSNKVTVSANKPTNTLAAPSGVSAKLRWLNTSTLYLPLVIMVAKLNKPREILPIKPHAKNVDY